jgi:hypothetical protein
MCVGRAQKFIANLAHLSAADGPSGFRLHLQELQRPQGCEEHLSANIAERSQAAAAPLCFLCSPLSQALDFHYHKPVKLRFASAALSMQYVCVS